MSNEESVRRTLEQLERLLEEQARRRAEASGAEDSAEASSPDDRDDRQAEGAESGVEEKDSRERPGREQQRPAPSSRDDQAGAAAEGRAARETTTGAAGPGRSEDGPRGDEGDLPEEPPSVRPDAGATAERPGDAASARVAGPAEDATPEEPGADEQQAIDEARQAVDEGETTVEIPAFAPEQAVADAPAAPEEPTPAGGGNGVQPYRRLTTRLGTLLVDEGLISSNDLDRALEEHRNHGERLGHYLVEEGLVQEGDLIRVLAEQYGVPAAQLDDVQVDDQVLNLVPVEMARRYMVVPLAAHDGALDIAMVDPTDVVAIANLKFATSLRPQPLIATERAVLEAIRRLYGRRPSHEAAARDEEETARDPRREIRRLILQRDQAIMDVGTDSRAAYRLAAQVDELVEEIIDLLREDPVEDAG